MMLQRLKVSREDYLAVKSKSTLIEFDWFGINNIGEIAIFSSVTTGYISEKVFASYEKFLELFSIMEKLPIYTHAKIIMKEPGCKDRWVEWAQQGIFAYDCYDVHRELKFDRYDLVAIPTQPLLINEIKQIQEFMEVTPRFNLTFSDNIAYSQLVSSEITK